MKSPLQTSSLVSESVQLRCSVPKFLMHAEFHLYIAKDGTVSAANCRNMLPSQELFTSSFFNAHGFVHRLHEMSCIEKPIHETIQMWDYSIAETTVDTIFYAVHF